MYERLLNKSVIPDEATIREHLGEESHKLLADLENRLQEDYQLSRELKFPFGSNYGWGYKYSHKSSHDLTDVIKLLAIRKKPFTNKQL